MSIDLASGSLDYAIEEVSRLKVLTKSIEAQYCIEDCLFHLRRAKECLNDGLKNPSEWMKDSHEVAKLCLAMIPILLLMKDQNSQGNRSGTQSISSNSAVVRDHMDES